MFTAALFTIARTWGQPRCPLTDEWIKLQYVYTMEYYPAIKVNAFESVLMRWMNLEPIVQSEVSQGGKDKYRILTHIYGIIIIILIILFLVGKFLTIDSISLMVKKLRFSIYSC